MIYINSIDYIEENLLEQQEETEFLIKLCNKYRNKDKRYYNLPLPDEIIYIHDNRFGYGKLNDMYRLDEYAEELEFYKHVAEHYDNNDFIIDISHLDEGIYNEKELKKFYISPEARRRVHSICDELEESIERLKQERQQVHC